MVGVRAGQVGEKLARQKASAFMTGFATTRGEVSVERVYLPLQTKSTIWSVTDAPIYAYNYDGGGYVIVSGDDRTADILGFSQTGHIDADRLPVNMKNWLQGYATKIERISVSAVPHRKATTRSGSKTNIATKMKTEWGQDYPYDLHTPELAIKWKMKDTIVHSATGCVATALSMVMHYYQYPSKLKMAIASYEGTSDVPVYDSNTGATDTIRNVNWKTEAIAAGTSIDWAHMPDKYNRQSTDEEKEAVSRIMQYCGCAVQMSYGYDGSSADNGNMMKGMKEVFGYNDVYMLNDFEYDDQGWVDAVYHELSEAGPVLFGGQTATNGGHEFVLDGYMSKDGKDYFYVNWGWDGEDNGYMLLSVMEPGWIFDDDGKPEGFTDSQDVLCGLGHNGKGYTTVPNLTLYNTNLDFGVEGKQYSRSSISASFQVSDYYIYFWNIHLPELTVVPAIGVYHNNELVSTTTLSDSKGLTYEWGAGGYLDSSEQKETFPIGKGLDDGTYTVKAITRNPDSNNWIPMQDTEKFAVTMTVSGNKCSFKSGGTTAIRQVVAETIEKTGTRLSGKPTTRGIYIHQGRKVMITP